MTDVLFELAAEGRLIEDPETGEVKEAAEVIERMVGADDRRAVLIDRPDGTGEVRLFVAGEEIGDVVYRVMERRPVIGMVGRAP